MYVNVREAQVFAKANFSEENVIVLQQRSLK